MRVVISKEEGEVPISQLGTVSSKNNALIIDIFDEEVRSFSLRACRFSV